MRFPLLRSKTVRLIITTMSCLGLRPTAQAQDSQSGPSAVGGGDVVVRSDEHREAQLLCFDFACDSSLFAAAGDAIRLYETSTNRLVRQIERAHSVRSLWFSPIDRDIFATAGDDCNVSVWHLAKPEPLHVLRSHSDPIYDLAFSPDGQLLASVGTHLVRGAASTGQFRLWNAHTRELMQSLNITGAAILCVAFSPDNKLIAFSKQAEGSRDTSGARGHSPRRAPGPPADGPESCGVAEKCQDGRGAFGL